MSNDSFKIPLIYFSFRSCHYKKDIIGKLTAKQRLVVMAELNGSLYGVFGFDNISSL